MTPTHTFALVCVCGREGVSDLMVSYHAVCPDLTQKIFLVSILEYTLAGQNQFCVISDGTDEYMALSKFEILKKGQCWANMRQK